MSSRYNLIDEKWIPVQLLNGNRLELGIHDTLLRSNEIAAIEDPSPLVVAALHRFLLAVLYRALEGPSDIEQAKVFFKEGMPSGKITSYLEKWRDRFWLFDKKHPFGQNPHVPEDKIEPWTKLTAEYNATTNKVLFDHTDTKNSGARKPNECARWLLSTMSFSISGGRGYYPSPSPNAMMCIPIGRNFHETLCYNLVPYPNRDVMRGDSALWERGPKKLPLEKSKQKQKASGYADLYTWQSRMVFLEELASGSVTVMRFMAGQGFDNTSNISDPMQPYRIDGTKGKLPVQFREDRGTWRDFDSLLPGDGDLAPLTIQNALRLASGKADLMPRAVLVLGLNYKPPNANVKFWRMERFALPEALVGEHRVRTTIRDLLDQAEAAKQALWVASCSYARDLLSRGDRKPDDKDVKRFVKQMPVSSWYWSILEPRFHEILRDYTPESDSKDIIRCQWLKSVRDTLTAAWGQHCVSVSMGDAWTIRALAKAEGLVKSKQQELNDEIFRLEQQKEDT
jgi:CRISPR system Cascade subunit CasA